MSTKLNLLAAAAAALFLAQGVKAQTNIQTFYDFGKDRKHVTTTIEGFYSDNWGSTFFFVDHDYNSKNKDDKTFAPSGTYLEISRALNFWKNSSLAPMSAHVEYNGGVYNGYTINNAFLFGAEWFFHSKDFKNTLTLELMYKHINYHGVYKIDGVTKCKSKVPLQFTVVWGMQDLLGVTGLRFSGFADFWGEGHKVYPWLDDKGQSYRNWAKGKNSNFVFLSEPQLWYNVGQHFGVENLNVGGEVELSYDFGTGKGFWVRPCLGFKWVF